MKPSKKTLLYTTYIIGITLFFLYYLFPSEKLKTYLAYRLSQGNSDITVSIDRVSPVLPPGIKLHNVGISHRNTALIDLDSLKIMPGLVSLFSSKTTMNFKGRVYAGTLAGRLESNDSTQGRGIKIAGVFSGVQVQTIPALQQLSTHKISGGLGGDFNYADTGPNRSLSGKLVVSDCRVVLDTPVFNQKSLEFRDIDADLVFKNRTLFIKHASARGNQLDADITGTIALSGSTSKNAMNLKGSITPHHVLLAKIEKSLPMEFLRQKKAGKAAIPFIINGTMDEPGFSLN